MASRAVTVSLSDKAASQPGVPRALLLQRLMGLTGLAVLGAYTVLHLWQLAPMAWGGPEAFRAGHALTRSRGWGLLVWALLGAPLVFHAGYGLWVSWRGTANVGRYATTANWVGTLRRLSGPVLGVFLVVHVVALRVLPWLRGVQLETRHIQHHLSEMLMVDLYVVGVVAAAFHLAAGLWNVLVRWGVVVSRPGQRTAAWLCAWAGVLLAAVGLHVVAAFHDARFIWP